MPGDTQDGDLSGHVLRWVVGKVGVKVGVGMKVGIVGKVGVGMKVGVKVGVVGKVGVKVGMKVGEGGEGEG